MFARVAIATCMLLALLAGPATADTGFTIEQRIPLAGGNTNDCTGEFFTITGYFHTQVHLSMTLNGRTNTTTEFNLEAAKGVGVITGARYVETAETSQMWNRDLDSFVLGDDSYTMVLMHYTVNANGTTTVDRVDVTITCR
ncbi:MAG TPA: hypothetical protein VIN63_03695 [Candidatus Limnocylindria bacterium]